MTKKGNDAYILGWAKKIKILKNRKCEKCGEDRVWVLSFHHFEENKDNEISKLKQGRISLYEEETLKCKVLCHNCHREEHFILSGGSERCDLNKKILLDYKKINYCESCGYDKCFKSLDFHHTNPNEKEFKLSHIVTSRRYKDTTDLEEAIKFELDKSSVLCANCHQDIHFDKIRFEKNKKEIYKKSLNIKEIRKKLDENEIFKLYQSGLSVTDIAKKFNTKKSTICTITRKLGLGKSYAERGYWKEEAIKLYKEGMSGYQISKKLKIHKGQIYKLIKSIDKT